MGTDHPEAGSGTVVGRGRVGRAREREGSDVQDDAGADRTWDPGRIADLGERFRAGDEQAFTELYRLAAPGVHDLLVRMVHDRAAAEDLTQATFLRAFERRASLAEPDRVTGWLYAIARNQALDHLRRRRPTDPLVEGSAVTATPTADPWADPVAGAVRNEAVELVWDAAAGLDDRHAEVLDLSLRHGLGNADLAVAMGTTGDHAAVLVHRAKAALGAAVRQLLVARRRGRCARLDELVPAGIRRLTPAQRQTVDHHLRRCDTCRATADELVAPEALFAAVPLLALPARLLAPPALTAAGASAGAAAAPPGSAAATTSSSSMTVGAKVAAAVLALVVVTAAVVTLAVRARSSEPVLAAGGAGTAGASGAGVTPSSTAVEPQSGAPGSSATVAARPPGGAGPAGPTSAAPLVTTGTGSRGDLAVDGVVVATEGCDGDFYRAAPKPGGTDFLYGPLHLDGDRLVLDATSGTYRGALHTDGVLHLETADDAPAQSTLDAALAEDGSLTGVWSKVFDGSCVLHLQIRSGHAPTVAMLTS